MLYVAFFGNMDSHFFSICSVTIIVPKFASQLTFLACHFQPQGPQNVCPHGFPTCEATLNTRLILVPRTRKRGYNAQDVATSVIQRLCSETGHIQCIYVHGARKFILVARKDFSEIVVSPHLSFLCWRGVLYRIRVIAVRSLTGHS